MNKEVLNLKKTYQMEHKNSRANPSFLPVPFPLSNQENFANHSPFARAEIPRLAPILCHS